MPFWNIRQQNVLLSPVRYEIMQVCTMITHHSGIQNLLIDKFNSSQVSASSISSLASIFSSLILTQMMHPTEPCVAFIALTHETHSKYQFQKMNKNAKTPIFLHPPAAGFSELMFSITPSSSHTGTQSQLYFKNRFSLARTDFPPRQILTENDIIL